MGTFLMLLGLVTDSAQVVRVQKRLLHLLGGWAGGSAAVGTYQLLRASPFGRYMGIQHLAWGAVDGAIAGYGLYSLHKSLRASQPKDWAAEKQRLRRILLLNALLDVGYMAAGAYLATRRDVRWQGTGWGIVIQGGFLLLLDSLHGLVL
ncbi:MAG: hypothetical protein KatS3mg026_1672 [Bacteroidia bacterium]|nr:MAG: hypothetical protein KatS3mg026_1672 [Bacteroidia bacterium]